jgi:hypothetical protein
MSTRDRTNVGWLFSSRCAAWLALLFAPLCAGGSCTVAFSTCTTCDPCLEICNCPDLHCNQNLVIGDLESARLESYRLEVEDAADGSSLRAWRAITGPSVARTWPGREWRPSDLVLLSRAVLRAHPELFGEVGRTDLVALTDFAGSTVVDLALRDRGIESGYTLLYDRAGTLIEIDERRALAR